MTAMASIVATAWKIYADRNASTSRKLFESGEREARQKFEVGERTARQEYEDLQKGTAEESQDRIQRNLQTYIQLEKWREESWQRVLDRLEQASQQLAKTTSGLTDLIDEGPHFKDLRMIKETAKVLDVFGDFQTSVGHFGLPESVLLASSELVEHITTVLLTLSPLKKIRESDERKIMLVPLRANLIRLTSEFMKICRDFERNPSAFIPRANAA